MIEKEYYKFKQLSSTVSSPFTLYQFLDIVCISLGK